MAIEKIKIDTAKAKKKKGKMKRMSESGSMLLNCT